MHIYVYINYKYIYIYILIYYHYSMKSIFPGNLHLDSWFLDSTTWINCEAYSAFWRKVFCDYHCFIFCCQETDQKILEKLSLEAAFWNYCPKSQSFRYIWTISWRIWSWFKSTYMKTVLCKNCYSRSNN